MARALRATWLQILAALVALNVILAAIFLRGDDMATGLQNTDTRIIAGRVFQEPHPWSWFWADWPLKNGFYRPIPAMSFLVDRKLFGLWLPGYLVDEYLVAIACVLATVWMVWELTHSKPWAIAAGLALTLEQTHAGAAIVNSLLGPILALALPIILLATRRLNIVPALLMAGGLWRLLQELAAPPGVETFYGASFAYRVMDWPPGRTAVFMTFFALVCVAGFLKWLREETRTWLAISMLSFLAAIGCYEQAVVIPLVCAAAAVFVGTNRWRHAAGGVCLMAVIAAGYLWWHSVYVSSNAKYQTTHFQGPINAAADTLNLLIPGISSQTPAELLIGIAATAVALMLVRPYWKRATFGILGSAAVFAPLSLAKTLLHYEYLSACIRTMFVVALGVALWKLARPEVGTQVDVQ